MIADSLNPGAMNTSGRDSTGSTYGGFCHLLFEYMHYMGCCLIHGTYFGLSRCWPTAHSGRRAGSERESISAEYIVAESLYLPRLIYNKNSLD